MKRKVLCIFALVCIVLFAWYLMPFHVEIPEHGRIQVQIGAESFWIEDAEDTKQLLQLLSSLRIYREIGGTYIQPAQEGDWVSLAVYDTDDEENGTPQHIGDYHFIYSKPSKSTYFDFQNNVNYRINNAAEIIAEIFAVAGIRED